MLYPLKVDVGHLIIAISIVDIISKGAYLTTNNVFISTLSYYDEKHFGANSLGTFMHVLPGGLSIRKLYIKSH